MAGITPEQERPMAKRRRGARRRQTPSLSPKANGLVLVGLGVLALLLSGATGQHPALAPLITAIRTVALGLMAVGMLMLWLAHTQQRRQQEVAFLPTIAPLQVFSPLGSAEASVPVKASAPKAKPGPVATAWSGEVFAAIEWRRFEAVCEALFAQAGFEPTSQSHGPDGGVDIWLHSRHADRAVSVVQCKHWRTRPGSSAAPAPPAPPSRPTRWPLPRPTASTRWTARACWR